MDCCQIGHIPWEKSNYIETSTKRGDGKISFVRTLKKKKPTLGSKTENGECASTRTTIGSLTACVRDQLFQSWVQRWDQVYPRKHPWCKALNASHLCNSFSFTRHSIVKEVGQCSPDKFTNRAQWTLAGGPWMLHWEQGGKMLWISRSQHMPSPEWRKSDRVEQVDSWVRVCGSTLPSSSSGLSCTCCLGL